MIDIIISLLLLIGTFFILSGSLGILHFPDVYTRLHAATKAATLGVAGVLLGSFLYLLFDQGIVSGKLLLGIVFVLITAPISGHMISRAAYNSGVELWDKTKRDHLKNESK
ncbi:multicomponent Na+:H+ antiporter subunit G [Alkalibacillus filiformis]|uniref:Multicomponent Na+:H+ antiporter subunit G n=1 Tax=Alkalibacillus filiformis TaxID=200990 RepID=A0ABU0DS07_9BACI|nr:monovalent cation/H(+) antiporter subunit G [Alkalibacillus filiformis]MDQ0351101.1 multicomponent Na+:H+ antiporter subunit G [Alkalibacillus filiformis]